MYNSGRVVEWFKFDIHAVRVLTQRLLPWRLLQQRLLSLSAHDRVDPTMETILRSGRSGGRSGLVTPSYEGSVAVERTRYFLLAVGIEPNELPTDNTPATPNGNHQIF